MEHATENSSPLPTAESPFAQNGVPIQYFDQITKDTPINPDIWNITGLDTTSITPPDHSQFAHGIVIVDDPTHGECMVFNKSQNPNRQFFNITGGIAHKGEYPSETFTREVLEETGITMDLSRVRYQGLMKVKGLPDIPLFSYHARSSDLQTIKPVFDTKELALIPLTSCKAAIPSLPWNTMKLL